MLKGKRDPARDQLLPVLLLSIIFAIFWNGLNLQVMRGLPDAEHKLRHGTTIATSDDLSYLKPAENLVARLRGGGVPADPVVRAPGYGLWYFLFRLVLDPENALKALVTLHILLFAAAGALLWKTLSISGIPGSIRGPVTVLYAVWPGLHGFHFYTLTEAVTPAYVLICACSALLLWHTRNRRYLLIGCLFWSLLMLTRPVLALAGLPLLAAMILLDDRISWARAGGVALLAAAPLLAWMTFESIQSGRLISPHPVYRAELAGIFRPTHKAFWELGKSWGMRGEEFHVIMEHGFERGLGCASVSHAATAFVASAPPGHLDSTYAQGIHKAFHQWGEFTCSTHARVLESGSLFEVRQYEGEQRVVDLLGELTRSYRSAHPFHHHVIVPLHVLKDMVFHSNLSLYIFQHTFRGRWWMELLRWMSLLIHVLLLALPFIVIFLKVPAPVRALAASMLIYLFLLVYVQRGVEERYTLPVLFGSVLLLPFVIQRTAVHLFNRNQPAHGSV
jgi:hypothetical protein